MRLRGTFSLLLVLTWAFVAPWAMGQGADAGMSQLAQGAKALAHAAGSGQCRDCHRSDDMHRFKEMRDCGACHQQDSFEAPSGFDHELAAFPLEGRHGELDCKSCHRNLRFHKASSSCVYCHAEDEPHEQGLGTACDTCHTPAGWQLVVFDYLSTGFELLGAHRDQQCDSCYRQGVFAGTPRTCQLCHSPNGLLEASYSPADHIYWGVGAVLIPESMAI